MSTGGDSGGDDSMGDGRKGGKRELSQSKRAAQNRAAQVCCRNIHFSRLIVRIMRTRGRCSLKVLEVLAGLFALSILMSSIQRLKLT